MALAQGISGRKTKNMRAIAKFVAADFFGWPVLCRFDDRTERPGGAANDRSGKFNVRHRTYLICIN